MNDPKEILTTRNKGGSMGNFGRITSLKDLPSDKIILNFIKQAVELNEQQIKRPIKTISKSSKSINTPDYFAKALKKNKTTYGLFENLAYSHRKEYIQWVEEAKTDETRNKRMAQALEWIVEGKGRNWKYAKK